MPKQKWTPQLGHPLFVLIWSVAGVTLVHCEPGKKDYVEVSVCETTILGKLKIR